MMKISPLLACCFVMVLQAAERKTDLTPDQGAVKKSNGRDALPRVRDDKPNTDAEHRVPTRRWQS